MEEHEVHIFTQEEMDRLVQALDMPPSAWYVTFHEADLDRVAAYCRAFDEREEEIMARAGAGLDTVLLSKYCWRRRMELLAAERLGASGDFAQYAYKALEELERLEDVDWALVERLDRAIERGK